jgi:transposase
LRRRSAVEAFFASVGAFDRLATSAAGTAIDAPIREIDTAARGQFDVK